MRHFFLLGLMLALMAALSGGLSAQNLKNEPDSKVEPKKDAKEQKAPEWPKEVLGKKLDYWVKEISKSTDPSSRESAIRILPQFGPDARKTAGPALLNALTKDTDISVRMTALVTIPLVGLDDSNIDAGLNAMVALVKPGPSGAHDRHTKLEAISALSACGPIANRASAIPALIEHACKDQYSWQVRKAGAAALASVGQPVAEMTTPGGKDSPKTPKEGPAPKSPKEIPKSKLQGAGPNLQAVTQLIRMLSPLTEHSHLVRRQAISSLIALGPPHEEQTWKELRTALQAAMKDPDQSVSIWARVAFIQSELNEIKGDNLNLKYLVGSLLSKEIDPAKRIEILQAIAALGDVAASQVIDELLALAQSIDPEITKEKMKELKGEDLALTLTAIQALANMPSQRSKSLPVLDKLESLHKIDAIKYQAKFSRELLVLQDKDKKAFKEAREKEKKDNK